MPPDRTTTPAQLAPAFAHQELEVNTAAAHAVDDLTPDVEAVAAEADVVAGIALVQSLHTTAGLLLNESEGGFRRDFRELAHRLAPSGATYLHDDMTVRTENICPEDFEFPNGHAHLQHAIFGSPSLTLPITDGALVLGRWQRILLVEYDRPRPRRVSVAILGFAAAVGDIANGGAPCAERGARSGSMEWRDRRAKRWQCLGCPRGPSFAAQRDAEWSSVAAWR